MQGIPGYHYARAQNDFATYGECRDEYQPLVEQMNWKLAVVEVQQTGYDQFSVARYVSGLEFVAQNASLDGDRVWQQFHVFH